MHRLHSNPCAVSSNSPPPSARSRNSALRTHQLSPQRLANSNEQPEAAVCV
jgi:hypothetical protein